MAEEPEPKSSLTKKYLSTAKRVSSKRTKTTSIVSAHQFKLTAHLSHLLTIALATGAALLGTSNLSFVQLIESQAHSAFFQLRGPIIPPEDIVILAIDDQSISVPEQYYKANPKQYAYLETLKSFPYKRAAYSQIIEKLINAGVRAVAIDVVFDTPSSYGVNDDRQLQRVLQKYGNKVTIAALYENFTTHQGTFMQLTQPQEMFRTGSVSIGSVNFPLEVDGKVHRLASEFPKLLAEDDILTTKLPSFDEAVLRAAQVNYPRPKGNHIYFWGASDTFEEIPLWYVFEPENWNNYLQQGKVFKDKIVLIGATNKLSNDYYPVAATKNPERMSGVEIHANAIATLMTDKAIAQAIPSPPLRGLFVLILVSGTAFIITRNRRGINRFFFGIAFASLWGVISYLLFIYGQLIFPTTVPMSAIALTGLSYLGTELIREKLRTRQIVDIFQRYKTSPIVQEIINHQDDLQNLLQQRNLAVSGKILAGRYNIVEVLGSGGFSETYIAEDTQRPGQPRCVVKQLKPPNTKSQSLILARRLFNSEAQTLEKLGKYNQIPQLLAFFEENEEFYLVQEYIVGHSLNQELPLGKALSETAVIEIVRDLLQTLTFVHKNNVIHRDIKPSNIIRRYADNKLVLIDFGAVKEVTTKQFDNQDQTSTIGIGTQGYTPSEQYFGYPEYSSDIYAVGMIGIKALTGIAPHQLQRDANGELQWLHQAQVSYSLGEILRKMVLGDYKKRYQSALEVLEVLDHLVNSENRFSIEKDDTQMNTLSSDDSDTPTTPWTGAS